MTGHPWRLQPKQTASRRGRGTPPDATPPDLQRIAASALKAMPTPAYRPAGTKIARKRAPTKGWL